MENKLSKNEWAKKHSITQWGSMQEQAYGDYLYGEKRKPLTYFTGYVSHKKQWIHEITITIKNKELVSIYQSDTETLEKEQFATLIEDLNKFMEDNCD